MDMAEKKQEVKWVFDDTENLPFFGLFEKCEMEISKNGATQYPVITLDSTGVKIKLSKWRTDVTACVVAWGKDSENWKGELCQVARNDRTKKIELRPVEENIK